MMNIPDTAYEAGKCALADWLIAPADMLDAASEVLQAAGPLLVAAELHRLATEFDATAQEWREEDAALGEAARRLRVRADQLIGPAGSLIEPREDGD